MKQSKIKIAITGGIGSGKSEVLRILWQNGQKVYSCDKIYAELISDTDLPKKLAQEFGEEILLPDKRLDRNKLSAIVFNDEKKLAQLNKITHPEIFKEMFKRAEGEKGITFYEVPLLFEGGYQSLFNGVIVVKRDFNERIASVSRRDGTPEENVKKRIFNQYNYDLCDFSKYYVIHNDGNIDELCQKTLSILTEIGTVFKL